MEPCCAVHWPAAPAPARSDVLDVPRVRLRASLVAAAGLLYLPMAFAGGPLQLAALQGAFGFAAGGMIPAANALVKPFIRPGWEY